MPRAGLITFHFAHHYGAQLQAYATMKAIQALGWECEIIDYRLPHTTRTNRLFKSGASVRGMASNAHTALHYAPFRRRFERFEAFVNQEMTLSPKRYTAFEELVQAPPTYDVYVSGSDQIWNPFIYQDGQFDRAFLLDFVKEGRRISYAPSLGVPSLPADKGEELKAYLEPYSALSVREKRGQALIRSLTGRDAQVVLDPTLLLNGTDWGALASPPKVTGPYILCYFVSDAGEVAPYVQALAQKTGYPIVQLAGTRKKLPGTSELIFDAGPREFLGLFQHAAYVCTNSFHGAAFSLQFDKPFFTSMSPKERSEPTYSRISSLLNRLGCADRIIGLDTTAAVEAPMDYEAIHRKLAEARADSLAYLKAALAGDPLPGESIPDPSAVKGPVLASRSTCTGCTACASVCPVKAITMTPDKEGFLRPVVGDACILCRKCEKVCPILNGKAPALSPVPVYAARQKNVEILSKSTSGGVFTALAHMVLQEDGIVFGAAYGSDMKVSHRPAQTMEELSPLRQTKYVQSDLGDTFRQMDKALKDGRKVLFTGTPCQVEGLKAYLGGDRDKLITCDLVCHGVPSPAVYSAWLAHQEAAQGEKAQSLLFRDKSAGWDKARLTLSYPAGAVSAPLSQTTYGRGFGSALFLRPSCYQCPNAGKARPGDFTLGDFWGISSDALPGGTAPGVSMVLLNSDKAKALWPTLEKVLETAERSWEEAVTGNPRLLTPVHTNPKRASFFAAFAALPYSQVEKQFLSLPSLPYRVAARILTPKAKEMIRKLLK